MITQQILGRLLCMAACLLFALPAQSETKHAPEAIKAAYVFNFLKYVEWPSEGNLEAIRIAYLGEDQKYLNALLRLQNRTIRGKALIVHPIIASDDARHFQVLITAKDQTRNLPKIRRALYGQQTLLISDSAKNKQLIMLNFTEPKGSSIGFEVNRYNMVYEKLKLSPDILVLGGTELDIAQLLRDMEIELASTQDTLRHQAKKLEDIKTQVSKREQRLSKQAQELTRLKSEVYQKESEISQQKLRLTKQNEEITKQNEDLRVQTENLKQTKQRLSTIQDELHELDTALIANRNEMALSSEKLNQKQLEISSKESFIKDLSTLINKNKQLLSEQKARIDGQANAIVKHQIDLKHQDQEIASQSSKIQLQGLFLIAAGTILAVVLFLILLILRSHRATKHANSNLATANE